MLMKSEKHNMYIIALCSILFLNFYSFPGIVMAENAEDTIVIDRYPKEELFNIGNTKPGDYAYRPLLMQNNNDVDILYSIQMRNDGDEKLFNELLLQVTDSDGTIFDGKLKDFEGFIDRPLDAQSEETIDFKLKFPEELGNEYQGLIAEFVLVFHAKAASDIGLAKGAVNAGSSGLVQGGTLPQTATNMFTYLVVGALLLLIGGAVNYLNSKKDQVNE